MKINTLNQLKKIEKKIEPEFLPEIKKALGRGDEIHVFISDLEAYDSLAGGGDEMNQPFFLEDVHVIVRQINRGFLGVVNLSSNERKLEWSKYEGGTTH